MEIIETQNPYKYNLILIYRVYGTVIQWARYRNVWVLDTPSSIDRRLT